MEIPTFTDLTHTLQTLAVAAIVVAACVFFQKIHFQSHIGKLPAFHNAISSETHRKLYLKSAKRLYKEGYDKFKDSVWRVTSADGIHQVVISTSLLPELKKLPDSVISVSKAVEQFLAIKYTKLLVSDNDFTVVIHSIRADLTPALARLNSVVYAAVEQALKAEMPTDCEDWTPVKINSKLVNMVAKITGRVFVGPELCRNEEYLDAAVNYPVDLITAAQAVKQTRPLLRPWLAPRLPEVRKLDETERRAKQILEPIIQARRDAQAKDPEWKQPDDMLGWLMNRSDKEGHRKDSLFAKQQLTLIFVAVHTTSTTVTNILYTLAAAPEYMEPLREEIRQAMAENGGSITTRALQQMVKLDSFMKETLRCYSGIVNFQRKVLRGFTLSNGQYIPPGVILEAPSHAIYMDDDHFPPGSEPADVFDGFRYYKLRQSGTATDHVRNQFVTTNEQNLGFGYGKHSCPGRFFAANEIKMLLARLLLEYDIKNEDGSAERYAQIESGGFTSPDPTKSLLFKRVKV